MKTLTKSQIKTLEVISSFEKNFGRFPRLRELALELGLKSHLSAYDRVKALVKNGAVIYRNKDSGKPSPFELSTEARNLVDWAFTSPDQSQSAIFYGNSPTLINYAHSLSRIRANDTSNNENNLNFNLNNGFPAVVLSSNSTKVIACAVSVFSITSLAAGLMIYTQRSAIEIGSILLLSGGLNLQLLKPILVDLRRK